VSSLCRVRSLESRITPDIPAPVSAALLETEATGVVREQATTMQSAGVIEAPPARRARSRLGPIVLAATVAGGISLAIAATRGDGAGPAEMAAPRAAAAEIAAVPPVSVPAPPAVIAPPPPPPPEAPPPEAPPPAPPPPEAAPTITLRFAIEPPGAAVELDGVFVTARQIKVHRDEAPHRLRITAPGFFPHERQVRFDVTQKLTVQLRRAPRPDRSRIESNSPY
jgi:hypothetical protein